MFKYTIVFESPSGKAEFPVEGRMEIGRVDSPEIMVWCDNKCWPTGILDQNVGRKHLVLYLELGKLMVQDLGSLNGTFLDGRHLHGWSKRHPSKPMPIEWNSVLRIGATTFRVLTREILMAPPHWVEALGKEHIKDLENLSAQALILLCSTPEQAKQIMEIEKLKLICNSDIPLDKTLILQLSDRPELAETVKEILALILNSGKREDYEKWIKDIKENAVAQNETYKNATQQLLDLV